MFNKAKVPFSNKYRIINWASKKYFIILVKKILKIPFFCITLLIKITYKDIYFGRLRSSRIGHFTADIDCALKDLSRNISNNRKTRIVLIADSLICNTFVLELIKRIALPNLSLVIRSGKVWRLYLDFLKNSRLFSDLYVETVGLSSKYESILNTPPLFQVTKDERDLLQKWLIMNYNLNLNKPFIFLHNRDNAYLPSLNYHSVRDFSPEVFTCIIDEFANHYNFFRGGKLAIERIQANSSCVDLPFIDHGDQINVLAQEHSQFYFGSDSGIHSLSTVFRKPVGIINFAPTSYDHIRRANHLALGFIPKLIFNKKTDRPVGLIEMYENNWVNFWRAEDFYQANLEVKENSKDEVLQFFKESLVMFNSNLSKEGIITAEQEEFWRIVTHYQPDSLGKKLILDNCFISPSFLRKNTFLFTS